MFKQRGVSHIVLVPTNTKAPLHDPIVDFDSLALDYPEHDTVVDLSSIELMESKKRPGFNLPSFRVNAPELQLIARLSLPLMTIHIAWLFDPAIPAPMMMLIVIAAIGNGIQHGFTAFRPIVQSTATIEDITFREQAKSALQSSIKRLRQAAARLIQSQKRYRNLFENTGTAPILVEKNLRISMANTKFAELTGFSKNDIAGKKRLSEFIERKSLYRIRRFHTKQKEKGLPLPTEYECLFVDKTRDLKHVVMKIYTPQEQETSMVSFFDITKRKKAEAALQEAHERLRLVSVIDELTQVANRRQFNEKLNTEWNRLKREGLPLSLIMCDVDCFKSYNDTYGHQYGGRRLRSISDALTKTVKR